MSEIKFLGFKQIKYSTWTGLTDKEKKGYIWFVRDVITGDTYNSYIYLGTRLYSEFKHEDEAISKINTILTNSGVLDASGNTVNLASLIEEAQLTEGTAIDIVDGSISVSVADETTNEIDSIETGKNFLKVNSDNKLEVKGIDTDATVTSSSIKIEGGPLAEMAKQVYTDGTLPIGTSVQSFLLNMLCVEKWAGAITTGYTFTTSSVAPTLTLSKTGTVEIGTEVTVNTVTKGSSSASQSITAKTMTYGYKVNEDGTLLSNTGYTVTLSPTEVDNTKTLKIHYGSLKEKNVSGDTITFDDVEDITTTTGTISAKTLYVSNGANTVTIYQTGSTYNSDTSYSGATLYVATNLGNFYKSDKKTDNTVTISNPWATVTTLTATTSTNKSVTGARAYFYGWKTTGNAVSTLTSSDIRSLQASGLSMTKGTYTLSNTTSASQFIIAFPTSLGYKLSAVKDGGALDADITNNFVKQTVEVYSANNYDKVNYDVWQYTPDGNAWDARSLKITIA